uniref:Alpha-tubulin N-acetyltransferase 1 n=1 Tax=Callorhinchus milii TaxID=7868 RepID=V9L6E1_CALMI
MEFSFDLNPIFPERISLLDHHLRLSRKVTYGSYRSDLDEQLVTVINRMGEASAKAQLLSASITTASRMRTNKHKLYVLRDSRANHGRGVVIGFLKVGYKKLFVLDPHGRQNEMDTLCVLDFYVHEALQRHGHGRELFDHMLQYEGVEPRHLAIDRPSNKFLCFLRKHYGLDSAIPQVNNFVVFEGFFRQRPVRGERMASRVFSKKPEQDIKPYSLSVRNGLPEEEKELPWPFNQLTPLTRSNSLGHSPPPPRGRAGDQQEGGAGRRSQGVGGREPVPSPPASQTAQHRRTSSLTRSQIPF